ncbi:hypothetical protein AB0M46_25345 [Dactylosporangium sp. NPDC051485]|uniref:hypothetical protein n=1 Tax=Dactylosporangium sp. NPDC051485 TaxID=3154846 RepID=UPI0034296ABF
MGKRVVVGLVLGLLITGLGVLGLVALVPGVGTPGRVTTTDCGTLPKHGPTCWGEFTPDGGGTARAVHIDDVDEGGVTVRARMYPWMPDQAFRTSQSVRALAGSIPMTAIGGTLLALTIGRLVRDRRRRAPVGPGR